MMNYFDITVFAVVTLVSLIAVGLIIVFCREELVIVITCEPFSVGEVWCIGLIIFLFCTGLGLSVLGGYIFDVPVSTVRVSEMVKKCPDIQQVIVSRAEILKHREAVAIYSKCQKDEDLAKQVTIEKQKKAALEVGKN